MEKLGIFVRKWLRGIGVLGILGITLIFLSNSTLPLHSNETSARHGRLWNALIYTPSYIENWFYDLRSAHLYNHSRISPHLAILEINDQSLNSVGRWPWSRTLLARVLTNLQSYQAKVVVFDVMFSEPESEQADGAFAEAIDRFSKEGRSVILGYDITRDEADRLNPIPEEMLFSIVTGNSYKQIDGSKFIHRFNFVAPRLLQSGAQMGYISQAPDSDGIFRESKLVAGVEGNYFPSLGLSAFLNYYQNPAMGRKIYLSPELTQGDTDFDLEVSENQSITKIPLSPSGEMKIRYFGGEGNFARVSIEEVLHDTSPKKNQKLRQIFQDKVVLIGSTAFAAHDFRHTPLGPVTPGLYTHANVFHALDQKHFYQSENESIMVSLFLYLAGVIITLIFFRIGSPLWESLSTLGMIGGFGALDFFYFTPNGYFIRLFSILFAVTGLNIFNTVLNVFREAQEKRKIRNTFQRYVAPDVVEEMLANPEKLKVGGEKKEITMLFSDVRDFTTISEKLTPMELAQLLKTYMGQMTDILFETKGTLDKYIGDALVGFWGAPLDLKNHAYQAVLGAQKMIDRLPSINEEFEKKGFPRINVGIGLNTGEVSVGNMGSDRLFQYTALGDHMNLAARLESLTKHYGVNVLISEFTLEKIRRDLGSFVIRPIANVKVKGKSKAVQIFELIPSWNPISKDNDFLQTYIKAYNSFHVQRNFELVAKDLLPLSEKYPNDKPVLNLLQNANLFVRSPPAEDWDGSTAFTSK